MANSLQKQIHETTTRFSRLIHNLGGDNSKGTERHALEVDFSYCMNDIAHSPDYILQKYIDNANNVIDKLIQTISLKEARAKLKANPV
jgi:hypothetical protein